MIRGGRRGVGVVVRGGEGGEWVGEWVGECVLGDLVWCVFIFFCECGFMFLSCGRAVSSKEKNWSDRPRVMIMEYDTSSPSCGMIAMLPDVRAEARPTIEGKYM